MHASLLCTFESSSQLDFNYLRSVTGCRILIRTQRWRPTDPCNFKQNRLSKHIGSSGLRSFTLMCSLHSRVDPKTMRQTIVKSNSFHAKESGSLVGIRSETNTPQISASNSNNYHKESIMYLSHFPWFRIYSKSWWESIRKFDWAWQMIFSPEK